MLPINTPRQRVPSARKRDKDQLHKKQLLSEKIYLPGSCSSKNFVENLYIPFEKFLDGSLTHELCAECEEEIATLKCCSCNPSFSLCKKCNDKIHSFRILSMHYIVPINGHNMCHIHERTMDLFCTDKNCFKNICIICYTDDHFGHYIIYNNSLKNDKNRVENKSNNDNKFKSVDLDDILVNSQNVNCNSINVLFQKNNNTHNKLSSHETNLSCTECGSTFATHQCDNCNSVNVVCKECNEKIHSFRTTRGHKVTRIDFTPKIKSNWCIIT